MWPILRDIPPSEENHKTPIRKVHLWVKTQTWCYKVSIRGAKHSTAMFSVYRLFSVYHFKITEKLFSISPSLITTKSMNMKMNTHSSNTALYMSLE
jgi:hypothetical protein